ncbi:MAG: ABC transporter permease [Thermoplasmata archaeon]|nr:ABC transporter permease [Thermoplasmata archaeon]
MSFLRRVLRNTARSRVRTIGLILIVSVSLATFLIFSQIGSSISTNVNNARNSVHDVVTVQEAGSSGFFGASTHITGKIVPTVQGTPGVATVQRIVLDSPDFTPGGSGGGGGGGGGFRNFTLFEGIDTTSPVSLLGGFGGGASLTITDGRTLIPGDENDEVAIIGEGYATDHSATVGSPISVNGTTVTVVGIFSTGGFGGNNVILPYPAAQTALNVTGPNLLYVTVNATANESAVISNLQSTLGSSYSVTIPGQGAGNGFASSVASILQSSQLEEYAALAIGAAIMILVMILVTSQRTREIGLLKAFGFSNPRILTQLLTESILISLIGLPVALGLSVWLGPTIAQDVLASGTGGFGGNRFGGGGFVGRFLLGSINFSLTPGTILLGLLVTLGFGVAGAAYPILRALRMRPSEILRHE